MYIKRGTRLDRGVIRDGQERNKRWEEGKKWGEEDEADEQMQKGGAVYALPIIWMIAIRTVPFSSIVRGPRQGRFTLARIDTHNPLQYNKYY